MNRKSRKKSFTSKLLKSFRLIGRPVIVIMAIMVMISSVKSIASITATTFPETGISDAIEAKSNPTPVIIKLAIVDCDLMTNIESKLRLEAKPAFGLKVTPESELEVEPEPEAAPESEPEIKPESEPKITPEPEPKSEPEPKPKSEPKPEDYFSLATREMMARVIYRESNVEYVGEVEASRVVWTMLNRLDSGISWFGKDMESILTKAGQYDYRADSPITEQNLALVEDVIVRWLNEKSGQDVGRTLPPDYYAFWGDGKTNHFWKWSGGGIGKAGDYKIYFN